jgi:hypothetical protein
MLIAFPAKSFEAVQTQVAALLKDRILVGHAVYNDLKALLLSHPHTATRDTQVGSHCATSLLILNKSLSTMPASPGW